MRYRNLSAATRTELGTRNTAKQCWRLGGYSPTFYSKKGTAAQATRATNLTLHDVVLRAAFDTPRVARTGAVELAEWDLLASLRVMTQIAPTCAIATAKHSECLEIESFCKIRAHCEAQVGTQHSGRAFRKP